MVNEIMETAYFYKRDPRSTLQIFDENVYIIKDASKIPFRIFCFKCGVEFEFTGYVSGNMYVYKCPKCHFLIGIIKGDDC